MLGFSLTKIVFTIIAVVVIWQGFKWFSRTQDRVPGEKNNSTAQEKSRVEEMVKCDSCQTFVAPGAKSCGRDDCPFPG